MSKYRVPWSSIMSTKKRARRASRARALARTARRQFRDRVRIPLRWGSTELKFLDCAWNSVAINTSTDGSSGEVQPSSGCTSALSVPAQGDGESQRDGRKYTLKSVWLSGIVSTTQITGTSNTQDLAGFFFALVLDTQANGETIVSENVYVNPSTNSAAMMPQPLRNLQNSKRFKVLASQYIPPGGAYTGNDAAGTFSLSNQTQPNVSLSWKGNIVCDSIGTTANVSSASDNAIHLVAYASNTALTPVFVGKARVRFVG